MRTISSLTLLSSLLLTAAGCATSADPGDDSPDGPGGDGTGGDGDGPLGSGGEGTGGGSHLGSGGDGKDGGNGGTETGGDVDGIQYFGRWDFSVPGSATASWGAVYLTTKFTGTSVTLRMTDSANDFQYRIDGGEMMYLSPGSETEHLLASGLTEGEHLLEFYRRSGGSFGRTTIGGLLLDEGAQIIPTERPVRKIEVLGDSISVGYGNEGMNSTSRATENGYEAYGPQLARMLGAQWSVVAHSGQGMVRNLGEPKDSIPTGVHMPDEFKMTFFPSAGANPDWDFTRYQPDVLIVTLGTNDFAWLQWDMDPGPSYELTEEEFVGGYTEFLEFARGVYPNAEIFAVGTFMSNSTNQFGRCNGYICQAVEELGDPSVHCIDPGFTGGSWLSSGSDYIGDWTHPTVAGHTKIATALSGVISPVMGW